MMLQKLGFGLLFIIFMNMTGNSYELSDQKTQINALMRESFERGLFNGSIKVLLDGEVLYENQLGYVSGKKQEKLTARSLYSIGSIAKEFSAVGVMILVERGMLKLDDSLADLGLDLPEWGKQVTVRHLLIYSSGLPKIDWKNIRSDADILEDLQAIKTLAFRPGEGYIYSNNNVFLQMRVIEHVSGMSYPIFLRENILAPLNMTETVVDARPDYPDAVTAFSNDFVDDPLIEAPMSGWFILSASDMVKWMQALHSHTIITKASRDQLFKSVSGNAQAPLGSGQFKNGELWRHHHHGSHYNFEAFVDYNTEHKRLIILMTNNKSRKLAEISKAVADIEREQPFSYPKKSVYHALRQNCRDNVTNCILEYTNLKENSYELYDFEGAKGLNLVGYAYLNHDQIQAAITIFKLAAQEAPENANAYDSLAEAYFKNGDLKLAEKFYAKSLTLNPTNSNAREMIMKIKESNP